MCFLPQQIYKNLNLKNHIMNDFYSGIKDEGVDSPWPIEPDGGGCQRRDKVKFKGEGFCSFP